MPSSLNYTPLGSQAPEIPLVDDEPLESYSSAANFRKWQKLGFLAVLVVASSILTGMSILTKSPTSSTSRASETSLYRNQYFQENGYNQMGSGADILARRPTIAPDCNKPAFLCTKTPGCLLCPNGTTCLRADRQANCPGILPTSTFTPQQPTATSQPPMTIAPTDSACGYKIYNEDFIRRNASSPFQCVRQISVTCTGGSAYSGSTKGYNVPSSYSGCMRFGSGDPLLDIDTVAKKLCGC